MCKKFCWVALVLWACSEAPSKPGEAKQRAIQPGRIGQVTPTASGTGKASAVIVNPSAGLSVIPSVVPSLSASVVASAAPSAVSSVAVGEAVPELKAPDGSTLPQTENKPSLESASYKKRIELLWKAIQDNAPDTALQAFFPLTAYEVVKATANPAADYQNRLLGAFKRDIRGYHRQLGPNPANAKLVRVDVQDDKAKWMAPGTEGNKIGYFRVLNSRIRFQRDDGQERLFELKSMISWRGEWYVVHLNGWK